jgi:hypothetical protein
MGRLAAVQRQSAMDAIWTGETHMSIMDVERQLEAEDLARTKRVIESILAGWNLLTWNELLADDILLSLRLGALDIGRISELCGRSGNFQVIGRREAERVLKSIYGDFRKDLSVMTEVISGYHVILLGKLAVQKSGRCVKSLPVVIYMALNSERQIQKMTVAIVDLQTVAEAIWNVPGQ